MGCNCAGTQGERLLRCRLAGQRSAFARRLTSFVLFCLLLVSSTAAAAPPVALDDVVTVFRDRATVVIFVAEDTGIDPSNPSAHPLEFSVREGPYAGELTGDLSALTYESAIGVPGGRAVLELTYTPRSGYTGTDIIVFTATDPDGLSSVGTIRINTVPPPTPPSLSGTFRFSFTEDDVARSAAFSLNLSYQIGALKADSSSAWSFSGGVLTWPSQRFSASFPLGDSLRVRSTLSFNPGDLVTPPSFLSWQMDTRYAAPGLTVAHRFRFTGTGTGSYTHLQVTSQQDGFSFTSTAKFSLCDFAFEEWVLRANAPWPSCDLSLGVGARVTQTGFDYASFTIGSIPVPEFHVEGFRVLAAVTIRFTTTSKTVSTSLTLQGRFWDCCVRLFTALAFDDESWGGFVDIYGVEFLLALADGIEVRSRTSFDPMRNRAITGHVEYFEELLLTGPLRTCCEDTGRWRAAIYFDEASSQLFSWGMTELSAELSLSQGLWANVGLVFRDGAPPWEITVGFLITW